MKNDKDNLDVARQGGTGSRERKKYVRIRKGGLRTTGGGMEGWGGCLAILVLE